MTYRAGFVLLCSSVAAAAFVMACSDDAAPSTPANAPDASTGTSPDARAPSNGVDSGAAEQDSGLDAGADANVVVGTEACGAHPFGGPAIPFGNVDASVPDYAGGAIPPGIYDAVSAERESNAGGTWRETFSVDGNGRFTRTRQIKATDNGSPGPVSNTSGTVSIDRNELTTVEDCVVRDGAAADAGARSTLPFGVEQTAGGTYLRYGATLIRVTLKKR